jgi:hypothetical protein
MSKSENVRNDPDLGAIEEDLKQFFGYFEVIYGGDRTQALCERRRVIEIWMKSR